MPTSMNLRDEIQSARQRIAPFIRQTRLQHSTFYSELTGAEVYFKCENLQVTGSFKIRGALNKYLSLTPQEQQMRVVAASTGNHGKAVAHAANQLNSACTIFSPTNASSAKLDAIRSLGAEIRLAGSDCIESESAARQFAVDESCTYISPYNDPSVVSGQGTIGLELCEQIDGIDAVFASMGGGGLISGIASGVQDRYPNCQIVGCSPENSNVMMQSLAAGKLLDVPSTETLSDGTAGGIENDSITFDLCQQFVNETIAVSEAEIRDELIRFIDVHGMLIEGAAAVAIAALVKASADYTGKRVVVVLCGANISAQQLADAVGVSP